ncbi:MAG: hypothetical protein QF662_07740, partial [Phycisphaerae bacterium]|nr:hypothetical protein [Phycisphaerae bacterium]
MWTIELMVVGLALAAGGCKTEGEPCESPHRMSRKDIEALEKIVDAEEPDFPEWFKWPEKEDEDYNHTHHRVIDSFGRGFGIFSVSLESPFEHYNGPYGYHFVFDYKMKLFGHF